MTRTPGLKKHFDKKLKASQSPPRLPITDFSAQKFETFDWHSKGLVNSAPDQGSCGSCWAFTAAAVLETSRAISRNHDPKQLY